MVSKLRAQRIAERIREEISVILLLESADPRLAGVIVTGVEVDREMDYAIVWVSAVEGSERSRELLQALEHAAGFLRSELAKRIELRTFPKLRFKWDPTFERAEAMEKLFKKIKEEPKPGEMPNPQNPAGMEPDDER